MQIRRTHDMSVVQPILAHPSIFPHIHDDGFTEAAPIDHEGLYWLLVEEDKPLGVFLVHAHNTACYEVHTCLLPETWGRSSLEAAQLVGRWIFENTPCQKLITHVPESNRLAKKFAIRSGFTLEGINRASFLRDGVLLDQFLFGITKQEFVCQQ